MNPATEAEERSRLKAHALAGMLCQGGSVPGRRGSGVTEGRRVGEWRPFETAPQDRSVVLVYRPDAGVFTASYRPALDENGEEDEVNCGWFTVYGEDIDHDLPTHWMPLPSGPDDTDATATIATKPVFTAAQIVDAFDAMVEQIGVSTEELAAMQRFKWGLIDRLKGVSR